MLVYKVLIKKLGDMAPKTGWGFGQVFYNGFVSMWLILGWQIDHTNISGTYQPTFWSKWNNESWLLSTWLKNVY